MCDRVDKGKNDSIELRLRVYVLSSYYQRARFRIKFVIHDGVQESVCYSDPFIVVSKPNLAVVKRAQLTCTDKRKRYNSEEEDEQEDDTYEPPAPKRSKTSGDEVVAAEAAAGREVQDEHKLANKAMLQLLVGMDARMKRVEQAQLQQAYNEEQSLQQQRHPTKRRVYHHHTTLESALANVVEVYHALPVGSRGPELYRALWALLNPIEGDLECEARQMIGVDAQATLAALGRVSNTLGEVVQKQRSGETAMDMLQGMFPQFYFIPK